MNWYVINTKPRQEEIAENHLRRLGLNPFFPRLKEKRVVSQKYSWVEEPLFPSYLFCQLDLDTHFRTIKYTRGVRGVVSFGAKYPIPVQDSLIKEIKDKMNDNGLILMQPRELQGGEEVMIMSGPLAGLRAIFVQKMKPRERILILLKTISYQAKIIINGEIVAPTS